MDYIVPNMEQIEANDLLVFAKVVECGGVSHAAEQLGWPKSTVSRRLAALEARLGERLLVRTTRRQSLTELGHQLLEHAQQVADEVQAVVALSEHRQAEPTGRLRVSMPSDVAHLLLADALAAFVLMHPAVELELDLSPRRVDLLAEGFDLAVRMGDLPSDAHLAARKLGVFSTGLYASPDYLAERGDPQHPDDLQHHAAVHLPSSAGAGPAPWRMRCGEVVWEGVPPGRILANSPELLIRLARSGAGIAAVPDEFAQVWLYRGALRRVLPQWCLPAVSAWAVFPERRLMPTKTRAFIDMLQTSLGQHATRAG